MMRPAAIALLLILSLSACASSTAPKTGIIDSMRGQKSLTEMRLSTAASDAITAGKTQEALELYKKLYGEKARDKNIALNYAQLLRKSGKNAEAVTMLEKLSPSVTDSMTDLDVMIVNEYAAALIQTGEYMKADDLLDKVIENEKLNSFHNDAFNLKGIALDAAGDHRNAEHMFRQALNGWKGDKTSVMNNLALSLASQGVFDESLNLLREALVMKPEKAELANNIALVTALRDNIIPKAPLDIKQKACGLKCGKKAK